MRERDRERKSAREKWVSEKGKNKISERKRDRRESLKQRPKESDTQKERKTYVARGDTQ